MILISLIFAVIATCAILSLVAADHSDRTARMHARLREEIEQAARRNRESEQVPTIGPPPDVRQIDN